MICREPDNPSRGPYVRGCRCPMHCEANRVYARERDRRQARIRYGIEDEPDTWVDPTEAREHLLWLRSVGIGRRTVAARTGLAPSSLRELASGTRTRVHRRTAEKVLAVGLSAARPGTYVPAKRTWELIDDLLYHGMTRTAIAQAIGHGHKLQLGQVRVTRRNADAVERLWVEHGRTIDPWHGTYAGYAKRRCRCRRCSREATVYNARRRGVDPGEVAAA